MLSYQHIYHAANFADVQKHVILLQLLTALKAKNPKLAVMDTHAGRGLYDLTSEEALKTAEFVHGGGHMFEDKSLPGGLQAAVAKYNEGGKLLRYPGSAVLARDMLRPADRLICYELHPGEFAELQKSLGSRPNTEILKQDGFKALTDRLPLPERKALIVIDPSYEIKTEYELVARQLIAAVKKYPAGCYMLWYPVLPAQGHRQLLTQLRRAPVVRDVLVSEVRLEAAPDAGFRMYGSGIAIINPPWPEAVLKQLTDDVAARLPLQAEGDVFWLDNLEIDAETGLV